MPADGAAEPGPVRPRVFRFGNAAYNEGAQELLVDGVTRPLETKPRLLLATLLSQANMVVSTSDLKQAVWAEKKFVENGSLTTAVYSLRLAFGEQGRDVIRSVPGVGYQLGTKVEVSFTEAVTHRPFAFRAGNRVPLRPQWVLLRPLSAGQANDVWLAQHEKTPELRVFKFAETAERLDALKREAALSRILRAKLGERADIIPVREWNFETHPYYVELPYGGPDLPAWLAQSGEGTGDAETRIGIVAAAARTVADAHGAGVLHGDIKPANILVGDNGIARLVDFGAGGLTDATRTELLTVTLQSLTESNGIKSGTLLYMAPEVIGGGQPTAAADIYALGILLYQMVVGDLNRPLTAGWEKDVNDPLLREDIAAAAEGTPALRLAAASTLADRLQTLTERRARRNETERRAAEAAAIADRLRRSQIRRPWVLLAAGILVLGSIATGAFALRVAQERDEARRQTAIAEAVKLFLTDDVLGRGNPASSGKANETLMEAATKAEPRIAFRLPTEPMVAAAIYLSLAQAFDSRSAYAEARAAYDRAIAAFEKAQGANAPDAAIARLKQARMEVMAGDAGSLPRARALIAAAEPIIVSLGKRADEARVWLLMARGTLQMTGGSVSLAQENFRDASDRADKMPGVFDLGTRLILRQAQASALFRLGQWDQANAILNDLLKHQLALHGPLHPDTLLVRLGLAQVAMGRGDAKSAVATIDQLYPDMVAVFGGDHRMVLQALAIRARASGLLGNYPASVRDDREIYRVTVAKQGEESQFAIYSLNDIAESECRDNDFSDGLRDAEKAYALAQRAFPTTPALPETISAQVAFCMIVGKQYAHAKTVIDGIDSKAVAELIGDPDVGAGIDLMRAAIAVSAGDKAEAMKLLKMPSKILTLPNTDPYTRAWTVQLMKDARP